MGKKNLLIHCKIFWKTNMKHLGWCRERVQKTGWGGGGVEDVIEAHTILSLYPSSIVGISQTWKYFLIIATVNKIYRFFLPITDSSRQSHKAHKHVINRMNLFEIYDVWSRDPLLVVDYQRVHIPSRCLQGNHCDRIPLQLTANSSLL